jgi:hypothetical protein
VGDEWNTNDVGVLDQIVHFKMIITYLLTITILIKSYVWSWIIILPLNFIIGQFTLISKLTAQY